MAVRRFTVAARPSLARAILRRATAAALLAALAITGAPALAGKQDGILRMAYDQAPENIDPYYNNVRIGVILAANVWDTLLYRDPVTNEYKPHLARSWTQVDDRTLEFELREGIKFHNGEPFDADSVVYTLNFVADPKNKAVTQANVNWIEKAEKLGPYKVRVVTKQPFPAAREYLATTGVIHPAKYYAEVGPQGMSAKPVGTGPYKIVDHQPGKSVTLERNTDYFKESLKGQPTIDKIVIRFIPDRQTQMAEALAGSQDLIMSVPKDQAEQLETIPTLQVVRGKTMRIVFLQMNSRDGAPAPQLKDIRVRKAIMHAIDRPTILKNLVGEGGDLLAAICTPSQTGCTQDVPAYPYDPALAKKLLAEAGYPNGFELDIAAYRERPQTEAFINYLQQVGIRARLNFLQYAAMRDMARANKTALTHQTWGSNLVNDVSASTPVYFGGGADDLTHDPQVIALLEKGNNAVDPAQRKDYYKQALTRIAEQAYAVPMWTLPAYYVANKDLDLTIYSDELPRFWNMSWKK